MRFGLAAATTLAALAFATPAAAQPNAIDVLRGVMGQLSDNTEGVDDYTLTLRAGPLETEVYVYRDGDEWEVASPDDQEMGSMLESMVVWPTFGELEEDFPMEGEVSDEDLAEFADIFNVTQETLNGRPANVVFLRMDELDLGDSDMPDSLRMYVDPATRQILRVHIAGAAEGMDFAPAGGSMEVTMDFADYRETDGLTIPRSLRMELQMELDMEEEELNAMRAGIAAAREQLAQDDSEEGRQMAVLIDMFLGMLTEGRMELPVTVEEVRVNTGPPSWFDN
jgi:hypothetical protein